MATANAFGLLGLLWLLFGGKGQTLDRKGGEVPTSPAPWPQALPPDLPRFPGNGWEYDEPPPPAVQERARQLVSQLWARGQGTFKTEQTAGRWITYRAEKVRSGKNGVTAWRLKGSSTTAAPKPPPRAPAAPEPPPLLKRPPPTGVPESRSPGLPQAPGMSVPIDIPVAVQPPPFSPAGPYSVEVGPASASSPLALPLLKRGAGIKPKPPDENVRLLQQKLGIAADGQFGAGTETAVRTFQRRNGLTPDGIVGPKTWVALFAVRAK